VSDEKTLTPKRERFVDEYVRNGGNGKAAAEVAGYSPASAKQIGSQLVNNPEVRRRIDARIASANVQGDEVIGLLAEHMRGDITDTLPEDNEFRVRLKAAGVSHLVRKLKYTKRTVPRRGAESEIEETYEVELYDAQAAGKTLANILGLEKKPGENPNTELVELRRNLELIVEEAAAAGRHLTVAEAFREFRAIRPQVARFESYFVGTAEGEM
jgi:hypothetical protein